MDTFSSSPASHEYKSTWTCNDNDPDVRRMVITSSMINQKAEAHRDSLGRRYCQLPSYYGLCYGITPSNIYNMCKAIPIDRDGKQCFYGDRCITIHKWLERLEAATGISRRNGLYECQLKNGQPIELMIVACSNKLETVPRPAARIEAFKSFLYIERDPVVRTLNQPKMYCL